MTEQVPATGPVDTEHDATDVGDLPDVAGQAPAVPTTGIPAVDGVLEDLEHVHDLPLEEQLAAFERAHESLRAALDDRPTEPPGDPA